MSGAGEDRYEALLAEIRAEFPRFRLIKKRDSRFQRLLHHLLVAVTLGQNRAYLDGYHTTLGQAVYVTGDWDGRPGADRYLVLRHERVHLRQFRRYTLVGMALLYLLLPLPVGLAYFRARFEREAYAETIRATAEVYGVKRVREARFKDQILSQFTGPSYGWMWPFRRQLERWYASVVAELA